MALASATGPCTIREVRASDAQEIRWRGSPFDVGNCVYRLRGPLVPEAFGPAFAEVIARHEALRCSLHEQGEELLMRIYADVPPLLEYVVADGASLADREMWLEGWLEEEIHRPFNRGRPPLLRAALIRLDEMDHVLLLVIDHIVSDGWSIEILAREISDAYRRAIGELVPSAQEVGRYSDWVAQERSILSSERRAQREAYWQRKFPNGPRDLEVRLPVQGESEGSATLGPVELIDLTLDRSVAEGLHQVSQQMRVTLFVLTGTVLVRLLQREVDQDRITLSTSYASRFSAAATSIVGYLARTVWIPTRPAPNLDLSEAARVFQMDLLETIEHADIPVRSVFQRLWGPNARELMKEVPQVDFLCAPFWGDSLTIPGVEVDARELHDGESDGLLSVSLADRGSRIDVQVASAPGLLAGGFAERLARRYVDDLTALADSSQDIQGPADAS